MHSSSCKYSYIHARSHSLEVKSNITILAVLLSPKVLIAGHLLWRWQWRRRMLSRVRSSVPGDNSFKHKVSWRARVPWPL